MKSFLVTALILVAGCRPPINVEAPTLVRVESVEAESLIDDPPYVPTVRWRAYVKLPGSDDINIGYNNLQPNGDHELDGRTFTWGAINASITLDGSQIRLDCSTGASGKFYCLSDAATMTATCERMVFQFTCKLQ
jgi:hypothetical protein